MSNAVFPSNSINQSDACSIDGKPFTLNLDEPNGLHKDIRLLYVYVLPNFRMHGFKVGMATCHDGETPRNAVFKRIKVQDHELALTPDQKAEGLGDQREVLAWRVCLDAKSDSFKDYEIHHELKKKFALADQDQEWFRNIRGLDDILKVVDDYRSAHPYKKEIYTPRREQWECINGTKDGVIPSPGKEVNLTSYFASRKKGRFLVNCKMRFGKCFTTYKFAETQGYKHILILTFVPAVEQSWRDDLDHIKTEYDYYTDAELRKPSFDLKARLDRNFVVFLSLQNYLGKNDSGETKEKIKKLEGIEFDLVVFDEYHFGAWHEDTKETIEDLDTKYQKELKSLAKKNHNDSEAETDEILSSFKVSTDHVICLSGTPFRALEAGEFSEAAGNVFTYSYFDEQRYKYPTDNALRDRIPTKGYEEFPDMYIYGYNMSNLFEGMGECYKSEKIGKIRKNYFSLNVFFDTVKEHDSLSGVNKFVYEKEVKEWLETVKGNNKFSYSFPFGNPDFFGDRSIDCIWLMPSISACNAMADLLRKDRYFGGQFGIINLSGTNSVGLEAKEYLDSEMARADAEGKKGTITLTVNKLTLGVTVKRWQFAFVMKDLSSPEQYFQAIFRIQTPLKYDDGTYKKTCYVYDFNIDRASALMLRYADEASKGSDNHRMDVVNLVVKYLPIFINGDMDSPIDASVFYRLAEFGDESGKPLSRRITDLSKTTYATVDPQSLSDMINDPETSAILKNVFAHAKFAKNKQDTPPLPSEEGFDSKERKKIRDMGYKAGAEDADTYHYVDFDATRQQEEYQKHFDERVEQDLGKYKEGGAEFKSKNDYSFRYNTYQKGYIKGINVPAQRMNCGADDGKKFVKTIKDKLGEGIEWTDATKSQIRNIVVDYLNEKTEDRKTYAHIPENFRGPLYHDLYTHSFLQAVKSELVLKKKVDKKAGEMSQEDGENVIRHILTRLFEFLYISVYREMKFKEVFDNADETVFLSAVGIKKEDFLTLNKYKIFQEKTLDSYIHDFFVNEELGKKYAGNKNYRNSFGWFGYGYDWLSSHIDEYIHSGEADDEYDEADIAKSEPTDSEVQEPIEIQAVSSTTHEPREQAESPLVEETNSDSTQDDLIDEIQKAMEPQPTANQPYNPALDDDARKKDSSLPFGWRHMSERKRRKWLRKHRRSNG